jgi:2-polyprenylphenol 6-hydroxylase
LIKPEIVVTDIAVVGSGPAGMAAALSLSRLGYRVALVGGRATGLAPSAVVSVPTLESWRAMQPIDPRVYAITPASQIFLEKIGVWSLLHPLRLAPMYDIEVFQGVEPKPIRFASANAAKDRLASIVEHGHICAALETATKYSNVQQFAGAVIQLETTSDLQKVELDSGQQIQCKLVVAADGGQSKVRTLAGIEATHKNYSQTAIVGNFQCDLPHKGLARQWFLEDGIVALLPLAEPEQVNLVWSANQHKAEPLLALDPNRFAKALEAACNGVFGAMRPLGDTQHVALAQIQAHQLIGNRLVLLGDAAHVIHPMAGHGLNLGFGDAACLVDVLTQTAASDALNTKASANARRADDPGVRPLLRAYERARREPIAVMSQVTDGLFKLFFDAPKPLQWARDLGWSLVGKSEWIKKRMIDHASMN